MLSECQVIYFVIPSHIYSAKEEQETERERKREKSILLWKTRCRYISITVLYQQQQQSHRHRPLLLFFLLLLFCSVLLLALPCTYARSRDLLSNRRSSSFSSYLLVLLIFLYFFCSFSPLLCLIRGPFRRSCGAACLPCNQPRTTTDDNSFRISLPASPLLHLLPLLILVSFTTSAPCSSFPSLSATTTTAAAC